MSTLPREVNDLLADMASDDAEDAVLDAASAAVDAAIEAADAVEADLDAAPAAPAPAPVIPPQPTEPPHQAPEPPVPPRPAQPPAPVHTQKYDLPQGHVPGGGRYPRPGEVVDLGAPTPAPAAAAPPTTPTTPATPAATPVPDPAPEPEQESSEDGDGQEQKARPWWATTKEILTPAAPAAPPKTTPRKPAGTAPKSGGSWKPQDKRTRFALFNGAAAAIGYGVGASGLFDGFMPAADQNLTGTVGLALNAAGWCCAWTLLGHHAVQVVLPQPLVARIVGTLAAGEVCRRLAPIAVAWLDQHATSWGLGPGAASLLITAAIVNGGLYWLIDRRVRHRPALVRFILRIPLATAAVTTLLYAPGPIL